MGQVGFLAGHVLMSCVAQGVYPSFPFSAEWGYSAYRKAAL